MNSIDHCDCLWLAINILMNLISGTQSMICGLALIQKLHIYWPTMREVHIECKLSLTLLQTDISPETRCQIALEEIMDKNMRAGIALRQDHKIVPLSQSDDSKQLKVLHVIQCTGEEAFVKSIAVNQVSGKNCCR